MGFNDASVPFHTYSKPYVLTFPSSRVEWLVKRYELRSTIRYVHAHTRGNAPSR